MLIVVRLMKQIYLVVVSVKMFDLIFREIEKSVKDLSSGVQNETSYSVEKRNFIKMAKSLSINLQPSGGDRETSTGNDSDVVDSDDDLVAFDLPEEKPFSKVCACGFGGIV